VFHAKSLKVNTNDPFHVKEYPVAFIPVRVSLYPVSVTTTLPVVADPDQGT
jgi:hypothetical protein